MFKWTFLFVLLGSMSRWPGALFLVSIWSLLRCYGVNFAWSSNMGITLVVLSIIVLVAEFNRSGTVSRFLIGLDLFFAVAALMLAEWTFIHVKATRLPTDWLMMGLVVWDIWYSTMNSLRVTYGNRKVEV